MEWNSKTIVSKKLIKIFFFFVLFIFKIKKLTIEIKFNLIEKIKGMTEFENTKIADEINNMIAIKLKCEKLINKGLFSEVYRC